MSTLHQQAYNSKNTYHQLRGNFFDYLENPNAESVLEHVYMTPEVNSNRFEISNHFEISFSLHRDLHRDFTGASFQTIARPYFTCANDIF